jgi:hypothetical protein
MNSATFFNLLAHLIDRLARLLENIQNCFESDLDDLSIADFENITERSYDFTFD